MGLFSWFSSDVDDDSGKIVAKTTVKDDGSVHRYEYTEPDDIDKGHGHTVYEDIEDFIEDEDPVWERDKDDPKSKDRPWHGEGFNMTLDELISLKESIISNSLHTTNELLLKLK